MTIQNVHLERRVGIGPLKSLDGGTATSVAGIRYKLDAPMSDWGLQVVAGSCNAAVNLELSLASTGDTAVTTTAISWASSSNGAGDATGSILWSTAKYPATEFVAILDAGASSNGVNAWVVGTP